MLKIQTWLHYLFRYKHKNIYSIFEELKKDQSLPSDLLKQKQLDKLNALLNHAYHHVPYYRTVFNHTGLAMHGTIKINNLDEYRRIPLLTKEIIRREGERLFADDRGSRKSFPMTSGGSTGEPTNFLQDHMYLEHNVANFYLLQSWRGVKPYESVIKIWGAARDTYAGKKGILHRIKDFIHNRITLNSFTMTDAQMHAFIEILNRHKPKMVYAYAHAIYELAQFAKEHDIKVEKQNVIHTAAGTLYDFMRQEIEDVFQCKVFNHYGTREAGSIASECSEHNGLHIMMEHTLVEVLDQNGVPCPAGEEGDLYITTLDNYSMPLIRYKIGDAGVMAQDTPCGCGCNYPKLQTIIGRDIEIFRTASGGVVLPEYFIYLLCVQYNAKDGIASFQVIQTDLNSIVVKIVRNREIKDVVLQDIIKEIQSVMGDSCNVRFEFVKEIAKTQTGKYVYIKSYVS